MDMKLTAVTFPEGSKLEHLISCLNETETQHLLFQILFDYPKEGCLTAIFRGNRAGDADFVKDKVTEWLRSYRGIQRHIESTA